MERRVTFLFSPKVAEELGLPREDGPLGLPIYFRPLLFWSSVLLSTTLTLFMLGSVWSIATHQSPCWLLLMLSLANVGVAGRAHAQRLFLMRASSAVVALLSFVLWVWVG